MAILKYKGSDGNFKPLTNILVKGIDVVQTSGASSADVMSQSAVTEFVGDVNNTLTAHTSNTEIHVTAADKEKLHTHSNKASLDSITGNIGTMAYEDKTSYSSATEVDTALNGKSNTGHTHTSNEVTAMTNYTSGVTISPISTSDTLNTAIGKLEHSLGGIKLVALSQAEYDALTAKDPTTLYIVI